MVFHKKKAAKARKWRLAAINSALAKLGLLKEELQRMLASTLKPARSNEGKLIEVPVPEEDYATWRQQLALLEEKSALLIAERDGLLGGLPAQPS